MIEQDSSHTKELNLFHDELTPQNRVCQGIVTTGIVTKSKGGTSEVYSQSQRSLLYREVFHCIPERILIIEAYGIA